MKLAEIALSPDVVKLSKSVQLQDVKDAIAKIPAPDKALFDKVLQFILGDLLKGDHKSALELLNTHIKASHENRSNSQTLNFKAPGGSDAMIAMTKLVAAARRPEMIKAGPKLA